MVSSQEGPAPAACPSLHHAAVVELDFELASFSKTQCLFIHWLSGSLGGLWRQLPSEGLDKCIDKSYM